MNDLQLQEERVTELTNKADERLTDLAKKTGLTLSQLLSVRTLIQTEIMETFYDARVFELELQTAKLRDANKQLAESINFKDRRKA